VPLPLCSRTLPGLSYQLLTSRNYNSQLPQPRQSQSQSYVTTYGQSASLSWCQAPNYGRSPDLYYCQAVVRLLLCGVVSDERTGRLILLLAFASAIILGSESHRTQDHILPCQIRDSPTWRARSSSVFISSLRAPCSTHIPRHWAPISWPPTALRATVEVFEPAFTQATNYLVNSCLFSPA
jgi:hypothetical protein